MRTFVSALFAFLVLLVPLALPRSASADSPAYLRTPDVHLDRVVFSCEGDLWVVATAGGSARRLTVDGGTETHPRFCPDGGRIAFTADANGNRDVYVMPADGGEPRRLTWHPAPEECLGWTPDGKEILFRSRAEEPFGEWELFRIPAEGGDPVKLPLGYAARIDIDQDSGLWAFNRTSLETRTWKRYRGGTAMRLWVGHPDRADFGCLTKFAGSEGFPMWFMGRLYFVSDLGGTANLWSMKPDGSDRKRQTNFDRWDVRWPAMGPDGAIVFMLGGDLHLFDPIDGNERALDVRVPSDRVLSRRRWPEAAKWLSGYHISPDGERLAVVTRGEVFSVPVKPDGVTLPVSRGSAARESWASFSPKGDRLVFVTDESREEAIVHEDAWGRGGRVTVKVAGLSGWHFPPRWSPDGKWLAWGDQSQRLYVATADGASTPRTVDRGENSEITEYAWSPDGRWLAYTKRATTDYQSVWIYDTTEGRSVRVTGPNTNDYSPAWDPDGRYLYFLSDRAINPLLDSVDLQYVLLRPTRLYAVLLRGDVPNPLTPSAGLPPIPGEEKKEEKKDEEGEDEKAKPEAEEIKPVAIDLPRLPARVIALPVEPGRYSALAATAKKVFFLANPVQGMAEEGDWWSDDTQPESTLMAFDWEKKKAEEFVKKVSGFELAAKAKKLAFGRGRGEIFVVGAETPPGEDVSESQVPLAGVVVELDPREEWAQIYYEAWRHMRDFHWEPALGGLDWSAVRDQYAALLPRLATRDDLRDVLGEVIGELATSHTYVWGGDAGRGETQPVPVGLLGADVGRVGEAFVVTRIYRGDPADNVRSPLAEPGVDVSEGEFLLAVNHRGFAPDRPFQAAFEGLADKPVVLTIGTRLADEAARDVVVVPVASDTELRYVDWVRRNREQVARQTGGRMGYVHIPDMGTDGLVRFNTWFFPQLDKEGMVVDARWNGGGFVSQMILERLRRRVIAFDRSRGGGVMTYPYRTLNGPFVVLTNENAGSDGDIFPAAVQLEGLAPVIGTRSWGGVIGIRADKRMVDGGMLTQPEYAWWDPRRGWGLENHGVDPDIEIDNLPQDLAQGRDAQLEKGIEVLLSLHSKRPPVRPEFGPAPVKAREAFSGERER